MSKQDDQFTKDSDSLYVMPLRILPIKSPAIQKARLIKDSHLDSAIELYFTDEGASGQLYLSELDEEMFGDDPEKRDNDLHILECVTKLHSFDVYSLRIRLRDANITIKSTEFLTLSDGKKSELSDYMRAFTMPLIKQVYGQDDVNVKDSGDIIKLFSDPEVSTAIEKLRMLSEKLNIKLTDIPKFLEDFSDIYLSFAYFQQYLDDITPNVIDFIDEISSLKDNRRNTYYVMKSRGWMFFNPFFFEAHLRRTHLNLRFSQP